MAAAQPFSWADKIKNKASSSGSATPTTDAKPSSPSTAGKQQFAANAAPQIKKATEASQGSAAPAPKAATSPNASSGSKSAARANLQLLITGYRGEVVVVQTTDRSVYEGVFHTVDIENNYTITLRQVQKLSNQSSSTPQPSASATAQHSDNTQQNGFTADKVESEAFVDVKHIAFGDIIQIRTAGNPFASAEATANGAHKTFATDTEISAQRSKAGQQRKLTEWKADEHDPKLAQGLTPSFSDLSLDDEIRKHNRVSGDHQFDQFATHERLTGKRSTFDLNQYSTTIDRHSEEYRSQERYAQRLAREIEGEKSDNVHIAMERGQVQEEEIDDDTLFSTVDRGTAGADGKQRQENGKYQPPAARKQQKQASPKQKSAEVLRAKAASPVKDAWDSPAPPSKSPAPITSQHAAAAASPPPTVTAEKSKSPPPAATAKSPPPTNATKQADTQRPEASADSKTPAAAEVPKATPTPTPAAAKSPSPAPEIPATATQPAVPNASASSTPNQQSQTASAATSDSAPSTFATTDAAAPASQPVKKSNFKFNLKAKEFTPTFGAPASQPTSSPPAAQPQQQPPPQQQQFVDNPQAFQYMPQLNVNIDPPQAQYLQQQQIPNQQQFVQYPQPAAGALSPYSTSAPAGRQQQQQIPQIYAQPGQPQFFFPNPNMQFGGFILPQQPPVQHDQHLQNGPRMQQQFAGQAAFALNQQLQGNFAQIPGGYLPQQIPGYPQQGQIPQQFMQQPQHQQNNSRRGGRGGQHHQQ